MAHAGFGGRIRVGRVAEPRAFFHQTLQAAAPLGPKFVDIVGAHLVYHHHNHKLRARWSLGGRGGFCDRLCRGFGACCRRKRSRQRQQRCPA